MCITTEVKTFSLFLRNFSQLATVYMSVIRQSDGNTNLVPQLTLTASVLSQVQALKWIEYYMLTKFNITISITYIQVAGSGNDHLLLPNPFKWICPAM